MVVDCLSKEARWILVRHREHHCRTRLFVWPKDYLPPSISKYVSIMATLAFVNNEKTNRRNV